MPGADLPENIKPIPIKKTNIVTDNQYLRDEYREDLGQLDGLTQEHSLRSMLVLVQGEGHFFPTRASYWRLKDEGD